MSKPCRLRRGEGYGACADEMATFTAVRNQRQTAGVLGRVLGYVSQEKKTRWDGRQLVTGWNCVARSALTEMLTTKERYQKTDGMMFYHFVQSFHPDEDVTPEEVHAIGLELAAKLFPGYEVLAATHTDTEHLHTHLIVNSTRRIFSASGRSTMRSARPMA